LSPTLPGALDLYTPVVECTENNFYFVLLMQ